MRAIELVPSNVAAFPLSPGKREPRIRRWDRDWNLVSDSAVQSVPAANYLTADTDAGRTVFRLGPV